MTIIRTGLLIINNGLLNNTFNYDYRLGKTIICSIDFSVWLSILLIVIQCIIFIVLLTILIWILMTDFYNKHFNFSKKKKNLYDMYLSIVKKFPIIFLTIVIGYFIRLLCRYLIGFTFLFEVNNNIIFKILVILLSLPWSSYLMNLIKKIIERKPIEDKDWRLFNPYVIKSVTLYNLVYISTFSYIFYVLGYSYYVFFVIFIVIILPCILLQRYKLANSTKDNHRESGDRLVLQAAGTSPILLISTLVLQAGAMKGFASLDSTEADSPEEEYPALSHNNNTMNFIHKNYTNNRYFPRPDSTQYEQLKESRILKIVYWQRALSEQGSTGYLWSYIPTSIMFNEEYAGLVAIIPESKSLVVTLVNRNHLLGSKGFMYSNYYANRWDPSTDKFQMVRETIRELETKFNMVIEHKDEIENVITFTQIEVLQAGEFKFYKVHRPVPHYEDLTNSEINYFNHYYGLDGKKIPVALCIKYNRHRVAEAIRRIREGVETPVNTSARLMNNCFDIATLKYLMLWKWLRKVRVEPRLSIGAPEHVDTRYEDLHHLIENDSISVLLYKKKIDFWTEAETKDISLAQTRKSALDFIRNSLLEKIDESKKNMYVICVNKYTVEVLYIENFRSLYPKIYTFMDPMCKRVFMNRSFSSSSYNFTNAKDEHSFRKFLDYITVARGSRGSPVFKSHLPQKDSYKEF